MGYLADAYPELVRRELRADMQVGNHSYNHPEVPPLPQGMVGDPQFTLARSPGAQLITRGAISHKLAGAVW